jgi:S1-C subfamily serine protease
VIPGRPAEKTVLPPGDPLIAVEGIETKDVKEIHRGFTEKGWRNDITFTRLWRGLKEEITK